MAAPYSMDLRERVLEACGCRPAPLYGPGLVCALSPVTFAVLMRLHFGGNPRVRSL